MPSWLQQYARTAGIVALLLTGSACSNEPMFFEGTGDGRVFVDSDPEGGLIYVDGLSTRLFTPDTVSGLSGHHDIIVRLDTQRVSYRYRAEVTSSDPDVVPRINGPLVVRCASVTCYEDLFRNRQGARTRFATNPNGALFLAAGSGSGIIWPEDAGNSYASGGMPMFAALMNGRDTVALGIYDTGYLAGRPAPEVDQQAQTVRLEQTTWILPSQGRLSLATVRGVAVRQTIAAFSAFPDIIILRLVFENISADPLYQTVDPFVPVQGVTFEQAFVGFALDPDIGTSTDDLFGYDLDDDLIFAYDARFDESGFSGDFNHAPAIVGLRALDAPAGTEIVMNGWMRQGFDGDWSAGLSSEPVGWSVLSGTMPYAPDHPHPRIGNLPIDAADARIAITAGPLSLAPGDTAAITLAVLLAQPVEGSFQSGLFLEPGDPLDPERPMRAVIDSLVALGARAPDVPVDDMITLEFHPTRR